jgi:hypothetical protein
MCHDPGVTIFTHRRIPLLLALLCALAAIAMTTGVRDAQSATTKSCSLSAGDQDPPGEVPTYNLTLRVARSTCTTAKKVMRAFHKCRPATGFKCTRKVLTHWTCTGRMSSSSAVTFYASFSCTWGTRKVTSRYQQNT